MSTKITKITGVVVNAFTNKPITVDTVLERGELLAVVSGTAEIEIDGRTLTYGQGAIIDVELVMGNVALDQASVDAADAIERTLANGDDINQVLADMDATAAGAGSGDEGGHSFVDVAFLNTQGHVNAGFQTVGIPVEKALAIEDIFEDQRDVVAIDNATTPSGEDTPPDEDDPDDTPPDEDDPDDHGHGGDGNNGHGNNTDGQDDDNPGQGGGGPNGNPKDGEDEDEGEQGNHGDDTPGSNQGNGGGNSGNTSGEDSEGGGPNDNGGSNGGPKGNNGYGNGDQDAPGNSGPHNNAENSGNQDVPVSQYPGNSGHGFDNLIVHQHFVD